MLVCVNFRSLSNSMRSYCIIPTIKMKNLRLIEAELGLAHLASQGLAVTIPRCWEKSPGYWDCMLWSSKEVQVPWGEVGVTLVCSDPKPLQARLCRPELPSQGLSIMASVNGV